MAGADRPADGRRSDADSGRRTLRLAQGDARDMRRHLRRFARRHEDLLRLRIQVHARNRTAVPARRLPAGTSAERDLSIIRPDQTTKLRKNPRICCGDFRMQGPTTGPKGDMTQAGAGLK